MDIIYNGIRYLFRECDVKGRTAEEVEALAKKIGHIQYDANCVWLVIPGVGYGMRGDYCWGLA